VTFDLPTTRAPFSLIAAILASAFLSGTASAKSCGPNVIPEGSCLTPTTVVWCEDGEKKTLDCKDGRSCKWNSQIKAFDCLDGGCSTDVDKDGTNEDVPPTGMCAGPSRVFWCESGEVQSLKCATGFKCGWNEYSGPDGAHDCIDASPGPAEPGPDAGSTADTTSAADGAATPDLDPGADTETTAEGGHAELPAASDAGGLMPVVHHDVGDDVESNDGDGGCQSSPSRPAPIGLAMISLLFMAWWVLRPRAYARSSA
jgi:hypothetical protein